MYHIVKDNGMSVRTFFQRYGIELLMLSLSVGLGTWFSLPKAQHRSPRLPDTLRVVTLYGATTYFRYKGEDLGQQYERIRAFTQSINLPFRLEVAPNLEYIHNALNRGTADISITPEVVNGQHEVYAYVGPEQHNSIVLVQRHQGRQTSDERYISNVTQLLDRAIYVLPGSRFEERLDILGEQLGGSIHCLTTSPGSTPSADSFTKEDLISMVSARQIDYALIDKELARMASKYYPGVDMSLEVGFPQRLKWVTIKGNEPLISALESWTSKLQEPKPTPNAYRRYLEVNKPHEYLLSTGHLGEKTYLTSGKISPFDTLFREEAVRLGWDWELLAAIAYQESNFTPDIIGRSGARGLMGIMPRTGQIFGANPEELLDPQISVRVSVDCLLAFGKYFKDVEDMEQRSKLTLAAYNAGIAHVQDAQRLADKYGADPKRWDGNVEEYIRLKSDARYYRDPVCKYGYLRGSETYGYVSKVTARAKMYKSHTRR